MPVSCNLTVEPADSWKQLTDPVEPFLDSVGRRLAAQVETFDPGIATYAEYALNGHGKHLRAALVALSASAFGKPTDAHVTAAVIIEMVHLATLVHDDIMDEAEIRRGRLTVAANWGNDIAVLFGDCLFANALKLAASFPTPDVCRAVSAATNTVCSGEILQTQNRLDFNLSREEYFRILEMKTAELFALSCELSAFISGAPAEQRMCLRAFGLALGTAYQLYDDCVDLFGSEAAAGKSLGTDLAKGKLTLPILVLWERSTGADKVRIEKLLTCWEAASMKRVAELLAKYETLSASIDVVQKYLHEARLSLHKLPPSAGRSGLLGMTDYLARQTIALGVCD